MPDIESLLPLDWREALLLGRLATADGPAVIAVREGQVEDLTAIAPTVAQLLAAHDAPPPGRALGDVRTVLADPAILLAPVDLQCIKAAGVTFAVSAIERVIEERAGGDARAAADLRAALEHDVGIGIRSVEPGSEAACVLKASLQARGLWSQYLEVAIGPDAEIFTKAPLLSAVGPVADIGVRSDSQWNNPEPEVVLIANPAGTAAGAALGNDVNLRDFEGRSALLLGKAKDNRASAAIGPFIRLFDSHFGIDDVRSATVTVEVRGRDGFILNATSNMAEISRDPLDLVRQAMSAHDYPDGFALFLGTLFAPVADRHGAGRGFTHEPGDVVRIASARLGAIENTVVHCENAPPWTFGVTQLIANLAGRGLLAEVAV